MNGAVAHSGRARHASLDVLRYASRRFPLHTQGVVVCALFLSSYLVYWLGVSQRARLPVEVVAGGATVLLLFFEMRLADDVRDLGDDHAVGCHGDVALADRRRDLRVLAAVTAAVVVLVSAAFGWPVAGAAVLALGLTWLGPAIPLWRSVAPVVVLRYEAAPAAIMLFCYVFWAASSDREAPFALMLGTVAAFWLSYEFWKFSRKVGQDAYQPYGLSEAGIRAALVGLLCLSCAADLAIYASGDLSPVFLVYALVVPTAMLCCLLARWPAPGCAGRTPVWGGLTFPVSLILAVAVEAVISL